MRVFYIFLTFYLLLVSSCKKENRWDMFKRTGDIISESRNLPYFKQLYVEDNVNVFITQGPMQEVKLQGGENLLPLIKTEVKDSILYIRNDNKCNWARSYKKSVINLHLTMLELRNIFHEGSGLIKSTDTIKAPVIDIWTKSSGDVDLILYVDEVYSHMHSSSDVTLRGYSILQGLYHTGTGYFRASDLYTISSWSHNLSAGNEYFYATMKLSVTNDWVGDIYYKGNPVTNFTGKGTGKFIHEN